MTDQAARVATKFQLADTAEGFKEILPKPDPKVLQEYYRNKYYQEGMGSYEISYSEAELTYFENRLNRFRLLLQKFLPAESTPELLDIGCGEGFAAAYFARQGFAVNSLDYSSAGVTQQNPEILSTHEVGDINKLLERKIADRKQFDVLILQNVLEHVICPYDLLNTMQALLKKTGVALITVPNDFSVTQLSAIQEGHISHEFWVCPPDHLSYFNTKTAKDFLKSQGWQILDMISDFPVDWYLFHPGSNYIADKTKGKPAHKARIAIENMIHSSPLEDVVEFYRAAARIGVGRDITIITRPTS